MRFFFIILAGGWVVKTFIFLQYPPGGLAKNGEIRYNDGVFYEEGLP
jgi:hypothetical protein